MAQRVVRGSRVLLTGASSGIGWHLALQLAHQGGHVLATARRAERLDRLKATFTAQQVARHEATESMAQHGGTKLMGRPEASESEGSLETIAGDITAAGHRKRLAEWCRDRWGALDCLINNAGAGAIGSFAEASDERLRRVMEVDFFAPASLIRESLPLLIRGQRSAIVTVGSVLGHRAVPNKSEYCAAKFAMRGLTESLRCELSAHKIEVIMISPSTTRTEFFESLIDSSVTSNSKAAGSMASEKVAAAIISAWRRGKRDSVLSIGGKILVWAGRYFPVITDRILSRTLK